MIARMTVKGVILIPLEIRRKFGLKRRTRVHMDVDEQTRKIVLTPITRKYILSQCGKYKGKNLLKSFVRAKADGE